MMKKIYYLLAMLFSLCSLGTCVYFLSYNSMYSEDFFFVLILAIISCAGAMIFGYGFYSIIQENHLYDQAQKHQAELDWYYYEQLCAEEMYRKY